MPNTPSTPASQPQDVVWLLQGLTEEIPAVRVSVLLSSDGIMKAAHGLDRDAAAQFAAMSAGLFSMARSAGATFDGSEKVGQIVVELESSQLYICWAGFNSVLAVWAQKDADPGVIGYQIGQLIRAVRPFLDTSARAPAHHAGSANRPPDSGGQC